jgi:hypothetical protein
VSLLGKQGILRNSNVTVVLASSDGMYHLLEDDIFRKLLLPASAMPFADQLVLLDGSGNVTPEPNMAEFDLKLKGDRHYQIRFP